MLVLLYGSAGQGADTLTFKRNYWLQYGQPTCPVRPEPVSGTHGGHALPRVSMAGVPRVFKNQRPALILQPQDITVGGHVDIRIDGVIKPSKV